MMADPIVQVTLKSLPNFRHCKTCGKLPIEPVSFDEIQVAKGIEVWREKEKCWLPAFSPFPTQLAGAIASGLQKPGIVW